MNHRTYNAALCRTHASLSFCRRRKGAAGKNPHGVRHALDVRDRAAEVDKIQGFARLSLEPIYRTVGEKHFRGLAHPVQVDARQPVETLIDAPDGGVGNLSLGLQSSQSQTGLSPDGLGPVKRGQEYQAPLDGLPAGGTYRLSRRV